MSMPSKPREYLIVKKRVKGIPADTVRKIGVLDDLDGARFASAMQQASTNLSSVYGNDHHVDQYSPKLVTGEVKEIYLASQLASIKWERTWE